MVVVTVVVAFIVVETVVPWGFGGAGYIRLTEALGLTDKLDGRGLIEIVAEPLFVDMSLTCMFAVPVASPLTFTDDAPDSVKDDTGFTNTGALVTYREALEFDADTRYITYVLLLPGSLKYALWLFVSAKFVGDEIEVVEL